MMDNKRVLAVKMDSDLFDELKAHVKELGVTSQKFINDLVAKEMESIKMAQQTNTQDIQPKTLNKEDVEKAIDDFIIRTGRIPRQAEYKNENGLPSYGAATRCLEMSAAVYGQQRYDELYESGMVDKQPDNGCNEPMINM